MTADDLDTLSDAVSAVRDFIETLAALNNPQVDAITDAIRKVEDIRGDLWKAAALAESEAAVQTMRDEARDVAWFRSGLV